MRQALSVLIYGDRETRDGVKPIEPRISHQCLTAAPVLLPCLSMHQRPHEGRTIQQFPQLSRGTPKNYQELNVCQVPADPPSPTAKDISINRIPGAHSRSPLSAH